MPKFIKTNSIIEVNRHGIESDRQVLFTADEIAARVLLNPSLVIEVTESHASQVVRVQGKYQELSEDLLAEIELQRDAGSAQIDAALKLDVTLTDTEEEAEDEDDAVEDEAPLTFGKK